MGEYAGNKYKFVSEHLVDEGTRRSYRGILRKFATQEEALHKDLYDFTETELLVVLESSYFNQGQLRTLYKKYTDWGIGYFGRIPEHGRKINLTRLINTNGLEEKWDKHKLSKIFTRAYLEYEIIPRIYPDDYINKAMILLPFEGIGSIEELLGLKIDALEGRWLTISNGRRLLLTEDTASVVKRAMRQKVTFEGNGESRSRRPTSEPLLDTGYLIRTHKQVEVGKLNNGFFQTRMVHLKKVTDFPNLSFTSIHQSGMMDYFFLVEAKKGRLTLDDTKRICTWFGEDINKSNNYSTFVDLYEKYRYDNRINNADLEDRATFTEFDSIFEEIEKVHIEKRVLKLTSKKFKLMLNEIHKAIVQHPNPESLSEAEDDDTAFQKSTAEKGTRIDLQDGPIDKPPLVISTGTGKCRGKWSRDINIAKTALEDANYLCQVDLKHLSFLSRINNTNFVEAHHLVPMSAQDEFEYSLDVPENIFSICPTCHRAVHHATDEVKRHIIEVLYSLVKDKLKSRGIVISLEDLLLIYGVKQDLKHT